MCGIAGIIRYGEAPITEEMCSLLLNGNEHRGNDATGMAISQVDGKIDIFKKAIPAWDFTSDKDYEKFINKYLKKDSWGVILHTRYATQGNPNKNENNHPIFAGMSAVIHNGTLHNDDQLFKSEKLDRKAEVDSDILRAFIDEYGITEKGIKQMAKISGSCSGAAFDNRSPKKMLLFRSGSPMTLGSTNDFFVFASERGTVYKALKPYVKRFNVWFQVERPDAAFSPMADNTAWIMGPEGHEMHREFKTLWGSYSEPFRPTYDKYKERNERWTRESKQKSTTVNLTGKQVEDALCPKCHKSWAIPKGANPDLFSCNTEEKGCGSRLISMERAKAN